METRHKRTTKKKRRSAAQVRKRKSSALNVKRRSQAPEVVYTPPKPFNRSRLLLRLATVAAVVIAVVLGISVFFRVEIITVTGNHKYSAWVIREASGIQEGENLLTFSQPRAASRIKKQLPYVNTARIGIKLPNTVQIFVEEFDVVYAAKSSDHNWWLIRSDGVVTERTDAGSASDYTELIGFLLDAPEVGKAAKALEETVPETTAPEEESPDTESEAVPELPVTFTSKQRMETALQVLQYLEKFDLIGGIASVDVTNMGEIQLWYQDQYQVILGDGSRLEYKVECMKKTIDQLENYQSGILDVSFNILKDQVMYTPF